MEKVQDSYWVINALSYKYKINYNFIKNELWKDITHSKILWYVIQVCFKYFKVKKKVLVPNIFFYLYSSAVLTFSNFIIFFKLFIVLQGLWLTLTKSEYWIFLLFFFIFYIITFSMIATLLYIIVIPWGMGLSLILLGPLGALLLHIQWILLSNTLCNRICHKLLLPNLNWQIYKLTISKANITQHQILIQEYENPNLNKQLNDWWWIIKFFKWIGELSVKVLLISVSFIPLIGPSIVDIFETNKRTRKCLQPFFKEQNWSKKQIKQFEILNKCDFIIFGIITGILNSIPLFSIITMTSNVVAGALWASSFLKNDNIYQEKKNE